MNDNRSVILHEIMLERERQTARWGNAFDDRNSPNDWVAYITEYAGKAAASSNSFDKPNFKRCMIQIAALATAAVEALERNNGMPSRHFDA